MKQKKCLSHHNLNFAVRIAALAMMVVAGMASGVLGAEICTEGDLADVPLEVSGQNGPPPLFMIIFNNTDSMAYEIMTGGADNGRLPNPDPKAKNDSIHSVYRTAGVNVNAPVVENYEYFGAWKGMCHAYNRLFYNPQTDYLPWPRWAEAANATGIDAPSGRQPDPPDTTTNGINAHVDQPRQHPMDNSASYDLTAPFGNGFGEGEPFFTLTTYSADQTVNGNTWMDLGKGQVFSFPEGVARIYVSHDVKKVNTTGANEIFAGPVRLIESDGINDGAVHDIPYTAAVRSGPDGGWIPYPAAAPYGNLTDAVGTYTVSWMLEGLDPTKTYRVETKWHAYSERSNRVVYSVSYPVPGSVQVIRRHFYLESADGFPYLIELIDADSANIYKIDESLGLLADQVEARELILTDYTLLPPDIQNIIPAPAAGAYSGQLQNFANWFSFYRTRKFAAQNAIGTAVDQVENVMLGFLTVPPTNARECRWVKSDFNGVYHDNSLDLTNFVYMLPAPGGSPNYADAILNAGNYFEGGSGAIPTNSTFIQNLPYTDLANTYPYFTEAFGGHCQDVYALMISDGSGGGSSNIVNSDSDDGYPFADSHDDTMADGAMYYYERDLNALLPDKLYPNYMDKANWQHMVTYGLSFGVDGAIRQSYPNCNARCTDPAYGCCPDTWPDPWASKDPNAIAAAGLDDLYHATVNGRGIYLYARDPQDLVAKMIEVLTDIERRMGASAAVTTNSVQQQIGSTLYQGLYSSESWWGDILAKKIRLSDGSVAETVWSARDVLAARDHADRKIFTTDAWGLALDFSSLNAFALGLTADEVNYIRGDRSLEGYLYRQREYILGDIVHSAPFYYDGVIYAGANDGMLHAFDTTTGSELFAYIPSMVHGNLNRLPLPDFIDNHIYFVNGSPYVKAVSWGSTRKTFLAGGLGKGGKGVYCLTVDNVKSSALAARDVVNWEYKDAADTNLGYVYGRAYVAKTKAGPAVIFGNGYASGSHKAVLYVRSAIDGTEIKTFDTGVTGASGCNGMSSPSLIDYNFDGIIDYVYAGDLDGNLWKFDLTAESASDWRISYGGNPLFTARDQYGNVQPITSEPEVMLHCDPFRRGYMVIFGTGRYLNEDDLGMNVAEQAMYGIYDWENDLRDAGLDAATYDLGYAKPGGALSNVALTLLEQTVDDTLTTGDWEFTTDRAIDFYNPADGTGQHAGWYFTLPGASERMVLNPIVQRKVVYFVTNTPGTSGDICSASGDSYVNALNACSGGRPYPPNFDINNDGTADILDLINGNAPSRQRYGTTLFDPKMGQGLLYINDTYGNIEEHEIADDPPAMRYWLLNE